MDLRALIERGSAADRAFADGVIRMQRGELDALHPLLRARADAEHADLRRRIAEGLRGPELRAIFDAQSRDERDHFVEEVLGIAYPPLDEVQPGPELIPYMPSGVDEILHAFAVTGLSAGQHFIDVGSGLGKAVMLAELLAGATASGLELDGVLHDMASSAARALSLRATFTQGDARTAPIPQADVVFMYLPFTGSALSTVLERLECRFLCAGTLDLARHPTLRAVGDVQSWLQVYSCGGTSSVTDASSTAPTT